MVLVTDQEILEHISQAEGKEGLAYLMKVIALQQETYWYDPCGKSGHNLETSLTPLSLAALKQARKILKVDG